MSGDAYRGTRRENTVKKERKGENRRLAKGSESWRILERI